MANREYIKVFIFIDEFRFLKHTLHYKTTLQRRPNNIYSIYREELALFTNVHECVFNGLIFFTNKKVVIHVTVCSRIIVFLYQEYTMKIGQTYGMQAWALETPS